ncbi:exodeoxyribonuclease VII large subunit [Pontivivens ytuae]|uniref:Exodeoxyribonuclease 7 large subunit n=1 Tax=Pontivivens ytuae TaxID=2789856 RepID=A0A7S9LQX0_9RHOB|nr:exodeoxyribonuclease VII large subunit [Pontivivens ytuae]QPH53464.1 exodeoxyribonuclease VII large subunit [Pontivivens ytuae]
MSELFDDGDAPGENAPALSVSDLSQAVKRAIEGGFGHVRVRGEVGRVSRPRSGHVYLDLKDDRAVLAAVIWKGVASGLRTQPEEGMEVVATGRLTTFAGQSRYQLVIEHVAPAGVGALMAMLEKRKAALAAEGLFAAERKRPLPPLPKVIGVVTSPSGAVIRDILHRLRDRFPREVLVWPVAVQGEKCAPEVAAAIRGFNALPPDGPVPRPDLLIVARGGGSLEDLWGFNEEVVVRAAAESEIPLISAVGHETDTTLIDLAADRRAPTPTAAAEMAVPVRAELLSTLAGYEDRRVRALARLLRERGERLRGLVRGLPRPQALLADRSQRLDALGDRLPLALSSGADRKRLALSEITRALDPARLAARLGGLRAELRAQSLGRALAHRVERARDRLGALRPSPVPVANRLRTASRELQGVEARLGRAAARALPDRQRNLSALSRTLETLSYHRTLERGYAVVRSDGTLVGPTTELPPGTPLDIAFAGERHVAARVEGEGAARPKKRKAKTPAPEQGQLF